MKDLNRKVMKRYSVLKASKARYSLQINQLMFVDITALIPNTVEKKLSRLVSKFGKVCEGKRLKRDDGKGNRMWYMLQKDMNYL